MCVLGQHISIYAKFIYVVTQVSYIIEMFKVIIVVSTLYLLFDDNINYESRLIVYRNVKNCCLLKFSSATRQLNSLLASSILYI